MKKRKKPSSLVVLFYILICCTLIAGCIAALTTFMVIYLRTYSAIYSHGRLLLSLAQIYSLVLAATLCLQLMSSRWKRARVFISFHHGYQELASHFSVDLQANGMISLMLPFADREHDETIQEVRKRLKNSDVVVSFPGADKSFVDGEIIAASFGEKAIIFVSAGDQQRLPDTALSGYPVFNVRTPNSNNQINFKPLIEFTFFVTKHWRSSIQELAMMVIHSLGIAIGIYYLFGTMLLAAIFLIVGIAQAVGPGLDHIAWETTFKEYTIWIFWIPAIVFIPASYIWIFFKWNNVNRVARQKVLTGNATYDTLYKALRHTFAGERVLEALAKEPLKKRY